MHDKGLPSQTPRMVVGEAGALSKMLEILQRSATAATAHKARRRMGAVVRCWRSFFGPLERPHQRTPTVAACLA
jgi:hypothetical protein